MPATPRQNNAVPRDPGEWKQDILRVYNRVKQEVSGTGVERQNVHVTPTYILIVAVHKRVPALATVSSHDPQLGRWADVAVIDANKAALDNALRDELGIPVASIFQDYDPGPQVAVTVVLLSAPLPGAPRHPDSA